jgi:hypothetical protein
MAVAGAGLYFVSRHIQTERLAHSDAQRAFDDVKASLPRPDPLFTLEGDEPRAAVALADLPTSDTRPDHVHLLAWDPDAGRLARISLPVWVLRFGKGKLNLAGEGRGIDLEQLEFDPDELDRIGPQLLHDVRHADGARVLLWTR